MTVLDQTQLPSPSLGRPWRSLRGAVATCLRRRANQRDYRHLAAFSDHELRDIGLTRHDVECALAGHPLRRNH
ncbi:hypothetical protein DLJ53_29950 [Acuticoccus sediminis]|uniref:YjiS-like domain-containing protein n=1 Tax=Acuticoccus sediminis TaxID=2184697 RepID=A0A8B2NF65_9HYPH|nr:DUF1127 domain-containing protein [Acuticoccus sediminis]RAH97418.1 hypothetical protein DLJ53_29950 [Acuticoccus sediminis]